VTKSASDATAPARVSRCRRGALLPLRAQVIAVRLDGRDVARDRRDAVAQATAIGLELRLTGAARADAAAEP